MCPPVLFLYTDTCDDIEYTCSNLYGCLQPNQVCDKAAQCIDDSDESTCGI